MKSARFAFVVALFLAGCSPVRQQLNAWQGANLEELIDRVGPPSTVSTDASGNKFYHWYEDRGGVYTYGGPVNLNCERIVGVDSRETIDSITWSGNCIAAPDSPWERTSGDGK